jgi:hypothetical protein
VKYFRRKIEEKLANLTSSFEQPFVQKAKQWFSRISPIFSPKIGESRRKLAKLDENWRNSTKTGETLRKLAKLEEK